MSDKSYMRRREKKKKWKSDSASSSHSVDKSQMETDSAVETGLLQKHERDANQHGRNVSLSLGGQDEDVVM